METLISCICISGVYARRFRIGTSPLMVRMEKHGYFGRKIVLTRDDDDNKGNPTVDFHGEKRTNARLQPKTDPEAKLYRKSKGPET